MKTRQTKRLLRHLEDIVDTVRPIMQKHGFAVSFRIQTQERGIG
ncbi:hypothetical protein [Halomonas sp. PA16-9]